MEVSQRHSAEYLRAGLSMPGNEVGDRVHNFFGQDSLSQGQHHSQAVDGNWPGLNNNLWVGNQRQIGTVPTSNPKNYNVQQSDSERGHGSHSSRVSHRLNFTPSTLRSDSKNQSQNQQPNLNGFMQGHPGFQTRQNEANFLGVDTESDRHNLMSRSLSSLESQRGNGPEHYRKNSVMLETTESPVNFDFLGGQPQTGGQQSGTLQSLMRQQSGFNDMQFQQQAMLKQMQEFQRQQQVQQQETRQQNAINQISSFSNQAPGNHSPAMINGTPIHDGSNYSWQPEFMAGNTNWIQRGASPVIQGPSNGLMLSPDQGQALRMMGLAPQQGDQSLYGVPVSNTRGASNQYCHMQMERQAMQQTPGGSNSFPSTQYAVFPDQSSMQESNLASRQGFQGKKLFGHPPGQSLNSGLVLENLQELNSQQRNAPLQEFHGRQNVAGSSETLQEKTVMQVASSQSSVALDPTEEKLLYGTDDSVWDVFGRSSNVGTGGHNLLDGTDIGGAFPSIQSGSWSALMQSAVAETSSSDIGLQEEWSGSVFQSTEPPAGNPQSAAFSDGGKKQIVWADNLHAASSLNSKPFNLHDAANMSTSYGSIPGFQQSGLKFSNEDSERLQINSSHRSVHQSSEEGSKWLDRNPRQKMVGDGSQIYGNVTHSSDVDLNLKGNSGTWVHQQNIPSYGTAGLACHKPNGWKLIESVSSGGDGTMKTQESENLLHRSQSNDLKRAIQGSGSWKTDPLPDSTAELEHIKSGTGSSQVNREDSSRNNIAAIQNSSAGKVNQETGKQLPNNQHDYWKHATSPVKSKGNESLGKHQLHLNKGPQVLESSVNSSTKGAVEMHEIENCDKKENSSDSYRSNFPHRASSGGLRENVWLDTSDSRSLSGAKQKSSGQLGRKTSGTRRFQYHPMGNLEVDLEPSYETKHISHSQAMPQQVSRGLKSHDQGFPGPSKFSGAEVEKGDVKGLDEVPSRGILPGSVSNMPASSDRSVGIYVQNKTSQSSQNMLELLHKVDQSRDHCTAAHFSSSERNPLSEMPETETSDGSVGHLQQNQSSASRGFGLQLAPPSQRLPVPNRSLVSQSSSQTFNSLSSHAASEIGDKTRAWLAPTTVQSLPPSHEASQVELRNNKSGTKGQTGKEASHPNIQGSFSASFTHGFPHSRSPLQNQHMVGASGQITLDQSVNASFDRFASRPRKADDSHDRVPTSQSVLAPLPALAGSAHYNNLTSSSDLPRPNSTNQLHVKVSTQQTPVLETTPVSRPSISSTIPNQDAFSMKVPNAWTTQQCLPGVEAQKGPSNMFNSHFQSTNSIETTSSTPKGLDDQEGHKGGGGPSEFGAYPMKAQAFGSGEEQSAKESPWQRVSSENIDPAQKHARGSQGKESVVNHISAATPPNSAAVQRDIEAFGRSLKPNHSLNQSFSLLHQMHAMKGTEIDPGNRGLKRFKGPESSPDSQPVAPKAGQQLAYGYNNVAKDASVTHTTALSGDPNMLSFSSGPGDNSNRNASSQVLPGNVPSQDMLMFGQDDSQNYLSSNSAVSGRAEHSQISPRMAPSWFDQYGTFKNGQMFPVYDAQKNTAMRTVEQPVIVGKSSDGLHALNSVEQVNGAFDTSQVANIQQSSTPIAMASDHLSAPLSLRPDVTDQSLVVVRAQPPKKRKSATCEFIPWHKEVTQFQRLQNISMAELDWAQATNRLIEKVEDEAEFIEDGPPILRPKRRLILTTQLMQQLLRPPSAAVLSADARSNCESVAYSIARLTLGDACSLISGSGSDSSTSFESGNLLAEQHKTSEKIGEQYFSKVMEDFISRARKLEIDLLRLDKRASVLDLRVDCQDLEKFSVINRFAKFHSRGQADGAEASSSCDATANAQKTCPQRYVTALQMPRNLPDRVQCLSL